MQVITVKLNNTNTTIEQVTFTTQDGTPTIIKSKNKINYEFINDATGLGPEKILTKRVGNDLHVIFKQDEFDVDKDESDLIIEGFYDNADHALIGLNADGEYQYYTPDSGEVADFVAVLNHNDAEIQILGDDSFVAPWWIDVAEGSPLYGWLLGIAGLTAGILSVRTNKDNNGILDSTDKALADATDAVKAAEAAEKAAEAALTAANSDGIISKAEADKLAELNQAVTDAKDAAQEALDKVPQGTEGKDDLTDREAAVQPVTIPAVTDADNNGILDSTDKALADATDAVKAAEAAEKAAEAALTAANSDGIISKAEADKLAELNQAVTDAKDAAQEALDKVPQGTEGKDDLTDREAAVQPVTIPAVTDADNNGILDTTEKALADATKAVEAAEAAEKAAEDALADANSDGIISQAEADKLAELNQAVTAAKQAAQEAVTALPDSTGKTAFQERLDPIDGITVPAVTDSNNNGVKDSDEANVEALVKAAEDAEQAAEAALSKAQEDGIISQEEAGKLTELNQAVTDAKQAAQEAVTALPNSTGKTAFQERLDPIDGITVPAVTDSNNNGVKDSDEANVEALVKAAEDAEQAAEAALSKAQEDGIISQEEAGKLTELNQAVTDAKQAAQEAVTALPNSTGKTAFQERLDPIDGITVPAVTDSNNNGVKDSDEANVEALVKAAEDAEQAAEAALSKAQEDGIISQEEAGKLTELNQAVTDAKAAAQAAVNKVADQTAKDGFTERLADVDGITVPAVNDTNNDGVIDSDALAAAEAAVAAAEKAEKAAEDALAAAAPAYTAEEVAELERLNQAVTDAKAAAQAAVNKVADQTAKDGFTERLADVDGITVPAVNDTNNDGVIDSDALAAAEAAVAAAEKAEKAAEDALAAAAPAYTAEEVAELERLNQAVTDAKAAAQAAVNKVADQTAKDGFTERLADVDGITVPAVNDTNNDGVIDSDALAAAEAAVAAAEKAEKAAEDALAAAAPAYTAEEVAELERLNQAVTDAKAAAQAAVNKVADQTAKDGFTERLADVDGITVPAVNDTNNDGVIDSDALAAAEAAVAAAEKAEKAAEDALAAAAPAYTAEEVAELERLNQAVTDAKAAAQAAVNKVADQTAKDGFTERLADVDGITVPAVNDTNNDGVIDSDALAAAEAAVAAAEKAEKAAEDALAAAAPAYTAEEVAELERLNQAVTDAKAAAQAAVNKVADQTAKDGFTERLADVDGITVPAVNDTNNDGVIDSDALAAAEAAVAAAEKAEKAAEDALAAAAPAYTAEEVAELERLNQAVTDAKAAAQAAVNKVADQTAKDGFTERLADVDGITVPAVNDTNNDGVIDSDALAAAEAAVAAAEKAEKAAEDALAAAAPAYTAEEVAELERLNQAVTDAKAAAQAAVNKVADQTAKDGFTERLADVDGITVPAVNDTNNDGVIDSDALAAAEAAVAAAEKAEKAAEDALAAAAPAYTAEEVAELERLNQAVTDAKAAAQAAVNKVADQTAKDGFTERLADVDGITVPAVNDTNNDGVIDSDALAAAEAAVAAAEKAEKAAEDALAAAAPAYTAEEVAELERLNQAVTDAKAAAQAAVNKVADQTAKDGFTERLADVDGITVPAVNDTNNDGVIDSDALAAAEAAVAAAEKAEKAAEDALAAAAPAYTAEEVAELERLNQAVTDAKAAAQAAVNKVADQTAKDGFTERLADVDGITVPAVNDTNNDGVIDSDALAAAEAAVAAAEKAEKAAEDALAAAAPAYTAEEVAELERLNQAVTDAKAAAQAAVNKVADQTAKDGFTERLADVDGITVPAVNDTNNDGVIDSDALAAAEAAVAAAEKAEKAAEDALAAAAPAYTAEEVAELERLNQAVTDAKAAAQAAVNKVADQTAKDGFTERLADVDGITVPAVNDTNNDGVIDSDALAAAEAAVAAAEKAEKAAEDALAAAAPAYTAEEVAELERLNQAVTDAKAAAQAAVNKVADQTAKDGFTERLADVDGITVPAVNDTNNDGVIDSDALAAAEAAVAAAEKAEKAAEDALAAAAPAYTAEEVAELERLNQAVTDAKAAAQAAVNKVADQTAKDGFTERLADVDGITVPAVNDTNNDGVIDSDALAAAEAAVAAAEKAEKAAEDALAAAAPAYTAEEVAELERLNQAVTDAKAAAQAAVNKVADQTAKDGFTERLADVDGITVPAVNDTNNDGVIDSDALAAAEAAVAAAEKAEKAAEDALAAAAPAYTAEEVAELERLNQAVTDAKAAAQAAVNKVADQTAKDGFTERLADVDGITVPAVNDTNNDGVIDSDALAAAEAAVAAAEKAEKAAEDALAAAAPAYTAEEVAELERLNQAVTDAKAAAQAAVNKVADQTAKDGFTERLADVDGITVPAVNDTNNDGVIDSDALAAAEAAVAAAEKAEKAAEDALAAAAPAYTAEEVAELERLNQAVTDAKAAAQAAVNKVADQTAKDGFTERLADVDGITVPAVNDTNNDGVIDSDALAAAEAAVAAAEKAEKAAEDALAAAAPAYTAEEVAELERLNQAVTDAKAAAQAAVNKVADQTAKDGFTERLADVDGITVPAVNDTNNDGVIDSDALAAAEAAVAAAEKAEKAAEDALAAAAPAYTAEEVAELERLNQAVTDAKAAAQAAVNKVADQTAKDGFTERLADVDGITVPAVNDTNNDGVIDSDALAAAEAAVAAAEKAEKAAEDALAAAAPAYTAEEVAELERLNQAVTDAKAAAQAAVNKVADQTAKDGFTERLADVDGITVPAVNDTNNDGVIDSDALAAAEAAVAAAEKAEKAAEDALAAAAPAYTAEEVAELERLNQAVTDAKAAAQAAVNKVADQTAKDGFTERLADVDGITVPAVNDTNNDGVIDSDALAAAEAAVAAAEKAEKAAEDALAAAAPAYTAEEVAELERLNQAVTDAKAAAQAAVNKVADQTAKDGFTERLADVDGITVPAVNDTNNDGVIDSDALAAAEAAVAAAEKAEKAAEDALAAAAPAYTAEEVAELERLNQAVTDAKAAAQAAVNKVADQTAKDGFTERLADVDGITVPAVNDTNNDGVIDSDALAAAEAAVAAAEKAEKAAEDALAAAAPAYTAEEVAELERLNQAVTDAKAAAQAAVNKVADQTAKDGFTERLADVDGITVPAVNDTNNDGVIDSDALAAAEAAVAAAEKAEKAAEDALAAAAPAYTAEEVAELERLNQAVTDAKAAAQAAVNKVADQTAKDGFTERLADVDGITVPAVNDTNNDGVIDSDALAAAEAAVAAAEKAEKAAEDALAAAAPAYTAEEVAELERLNQAVTDAKAAAQAAVNKVADQTAKDGFTERLADVDGITVPAVNDTNNDGVIDSDALAAAEAAVAAAEKAEKAAEDALAAAAPAYTAEEVAELERLNQAVTDAKAAAQAAVNKVADQTAKDGFTERLADVDGITVPAVNDTNNDGVIDSDALAAAEAAVAAAEKAEKAAEDALAAAAPAYTAEEVAELERLNQAVTDAKAAAQAAVNKVADQTAKDGFTERLADVDGITVPAVNDTNNDGVIDSDALAAAEAAVAAAEKAEKAAEDALAAAAPAYTAEEVAELERLNQAVTDAKAAAQAAVNKVADQTAKDGFTERLADVDGITVPAVNDTNDNDIDDTVENDIADLIKRAEDKAQEAKDKLAELSQDGLITKEDKAAVEAINDQLEVLKSEIEQKIAELPSGDVKQSFTDQVDQIAPAEVALSVFITQYKDDYGDVTGNFGTDTTTDDNTLTFMGEGEAGQTLYFYMKGIDGDLVNMGSTAITATGTWEFTPTWLTNREHTVYASYLTPEQVAGETKLDNPFTVTVQGPTAPPQDIGAKSQIWSTSTTGDVNGDGFDDLVSLSWTGNYGDVMLGGAQISANLGNITSSAVWHQAGVGDVNGDGYNDILYATAQNGGGGQVMFGDGQLGKLSSPRVLATLSGSTNNGVASAGDVNGDGLTDMLALGATNSSLYYGKQGMSGAQTAAVTGLTFGQASAGTTATWGAQQYAAGIGDFNGDGYGDVVTATGIYFGSAAGLSNDNSIKFNHAVTSANAAGDVNGDGYADAVIVDGVNRTAYVVYGGKAAAGSTITLGTKTTSAVNLSITGANGGFAIGSTLKGYQTTEYSVAAGLGDINGDGLSDMLITTYGNNTADNQKNTTGIAGRANYFATDSYIVYGSAVGKTIDTSTLADSTDGLVMPESQADGSSATGMTDVNGDGLADVYINSYSTPGKLYLGGAGLGAEPSVKLDSADTINGTLKSNFLVGSAGDDVLIGNGGADVIYAGAGNDKIVLNHDNLSMLSLGLQTANSDGSIINNGDGRLARVDGGSGVNTLSFDSTVVEVNLTNISNAGKGFIETSVGMSRIANIQQLDLTQTNAELTLSLTDVMDMNAGVNAFAFHTIRGQDDIAPELDLTPELYDNTDWVVTPVSRHQLLIQGDAGDTVNITKASEWIQTPAMTVTKGGESYHVYNSVGANQGQLLIDTDMLVKFII